MPLFCSGSLLRRVWSSRADEYEKSGTLWAGMGIVAARILLLSLERNYCCFLIFGPLQQEQDWART